MNLFDYKGYSSEDLEAICPYSYTESFTPACKYWTSEVYSMGYFLRKYAYYPSYLPLFCYSSHGANLHLKIGKHEIENDAPFILYHNQKLKEKFVKKSQKPCYIIPCPLPWLRKEYRLEKSTQAKGTLAYFAHTTPEMGFLRTNEEVVDEYVKSLKKLPEHLHPICVSLHMHDVNRGIHKLFMKHNIPVYSAGNALNPLFFKRFYDILLNFKYTTSSALGSNSVYSIEANIPFFLHGKKELYWNVSDENLEKGVYGDKKNNMLLAIEKEFREFSEEVTPAQRELANKILCPEMTISRRRLSFELYWAAIKRLSSRC